MQAVRAIIHSDVLMNIFSLPFDLQHRKVEVLILPADDQPTTRSLCKPQEYVGSLKLADAITDNSTIDEVREQMDIAGDKVGCPESSVTALRGSFRGKLSAVDAFMAAKQAEKEAEL